MNETSTATVIAGCNHHLSFRNVRSFICARAEEKTPVALPVFKTGALGRYASPPWENLPSPRYVLKIRLLLLALFWLIQVRKCWFEIEAESNRDNMDHNNCSNADHNSCI